ncbi:MAG: hypothetical protein ACJ74Y_13980 [Bryobacteraceae bacterium]|jgi:hypothetical protein
MDCPCEGKHGRGWHRVRKLQQCEHIKELRKDEEAKYTRKQTNRNPPGVGYKTWIPGTSILLPDDEEL